MGFKLGAALALLLITILAGIWLSNSGKPLQPWLITFHKLLAVGAVAFAVLGFVQWQKGVSIPAVLFALLIVTGVSVAVLFATGAFLSQNKAMPGFVLLLHRAATLVTLLTTVLMLWKIR